VLRSWVVQYRRGGATRRLLLGSAAVLGAEAARAAAKKALAKVALGEDPQAERVDRRGKDKLSLRSVVDEYLATKERDVRPRTFRELKRYLTGSFFKPLHAIPVDTVTRRDVAARLVAITREHGSIVAARARAALSTFFVWAMQMGMVENNPSSARSSRRMASHASGRCRMTNWLRSGVPVRTMTTAASFAC